MGNQEGEVESGKGQRDGKGGMGREGGEEEGWEGRGGSHIDVPPLKELLNIVFCALK